MKWHKHGGIARATEALGCSRSTVERLADGRTPLTAETRLAMTAIHQGLKPWEPKDFGLPKFHIGLSFTKERSIDHDTNQTV